MNDSETYDDNRAQISQFLSSYLVACPRCGSKAHVQIVGEAPMLLFAPRRLACASCGYSTEWRANGVVSSFDDEPRDWYFGAEFWHQVRCCGHVLWVANREHLEFLKHYVGAKIRSHTRDEQGWSNRSLSARLPRWLTAADNRDKVMKALAQLEAQL